MRKIALSPLQKAPPTTLPRRECAPLTHILDTQLTTRRDGLVARPSRFAAIDHSESSSCHCNPTECSRSPGGALAIHAPRFLLLSSCSRLPSRESPSASTTRLVLSTARRQCTREKTLLSCAAERGAALLRVAQAPRALSTRARRGREAVGQRRYSVVPASVGSRASRRASSTWLRAPVLSSTCER